MKITENFKAHQGDVQIYSIESIPENAKSIEKTYFAKSEKSGHCHALCGDYSLYEVEGGHVINIGEEGAILNHTQLSNLTKEYWNENKVTKIADHKPTTLVKGTYFVGIQVRKKPFSKIWEKVID